jgi:hypothetical protein
VIRPGFELRQALKLLALLCQRPVLYTRSNLRLINRGLFYLSESPDLAWWNLLIDQDAAMTMDILVVIAEKGAPVFSLLIGKGLIGGVSNDLLGSFRDLDSFREQIEAGVDRPLQAVMVDAAIINRVNSKLVAQPKVDAFFVAGSEILAALKDRMIVFSPVMPEVEMLASLNGEELLAKFGPRYGLRIGNPVRFAGVIRGLRLAIKSPVTKWRMKKAF